MIESFSSPPLFNILCVCLGAGVFFSPHIWLIKKIRSKVSYDDPLGTGVFKTAMATLFGVTLLSFLNGFSVGAGVLWPEFVLLCVLLIGALVYHAIRGSDLRTAPQKLGVFLFFTILKVLGFMFVAWIAIQSLMLLFLWLNTVLPLAVFQPVREATFLIGALWIGLLYWLYKRKAAAVELKFHYLFWPLVLGLLILMLPMLLQNFVNSEDFQDSLKRPPSLQKV